MDPKHIDTQISSMSFLAWEGFIFWLDDRLGHYHFVKYNSSVMQLHGKCLRAASIYCWVSIITFNHFVK